jgi:2-hydroxycyclohexanecarboxyl-CoA dehydrogenase
MPETWIERSETEAMPDSSNDLSPSPRRALVTGGARGIGAAVVQRLRQAQMSVVVFDLVYEPESCFAQDPEVLALVIDVTDHRAVIEAVAQHGPFDVLVNNAGMDQHAFFTQTQPMQWRQLLAVNLEAVFSATLAVLPGMQARGYGRVINVASEAGRMGSRGGAVYAAAKGGVIAFTQSIARENSANGITANAVAPGPIDTPMLRAALGRGGDRLFQAMTSATLCGRLGTAQEVAAAVAFLASEDAGFITGETLGVSGGMGCGQA